MNKEYFVQQDAFLEDYKKGLIDENKINIASIKKFQNSQTSKRI